MPVSLLVGVLPGFPDSFPPSAVQAAKSISEKRVAKITEIIFFIALPFKFIYKLFLRIIN